MSYVDLKHLLADLALEAVRHPEDAGWIAVAIACAELITAEQPRVLRRDCLKRAAALSAPFGWTPIEADVQRLIDAGLFTARADLLVLSDRFLPHLAYFHRHTPRVLKAVAELRGGDASSAVLPKVRVGAALFNAGLFFESHEWFEGLWKAATGEEKEFYHGLVQAAAAFYHYEKDNRHGSRTLLGKAQRRLAAYPDRFLGVDLGRFRNALEQWAAHFAGGPRPRDYPGLAPPGGGIPGKAEGAPRG